MVDKEFGDFAEFVEGSPAPEVDDTASDDAVDAGTMDADVEVEDVDEVDKVDEVDDDTDLDPDEDVDDVDAVAADDDATVEDDAEAELTPEEINESLRTQLAAALAVKSPATKPEEKATEPDVVDEVIPDFITEENFDAILEDPKKLNEVIYKAVQAGVNAQMKAIQTGAVEAVQLSVPNMVASQVAQQNAVNEAVSGFYAEHKELSKYREVVASNINTVAAEHPEWTLEQTMPEAASRSYTQLHLNKRANEAVSNGDAKSTGLRKGGRKGKSSARGKKTDARTSLQQEMDALEF